jgi:DnaK suppressor protein
MNTTRALSRAQLRELRLELEGERARLEHAMARDAASRDGATHTSSVPDADAASESDGGLGVALSRRTETRHAAILDALRRLDEGSYGVCESCGQSIPYGRLLVMPETKHCVSCGARA